MHPTAHCTDAADVALGALGDGLTRTTGVQQGIQEGSNRVEAVTPQWKQTRKETNDGIL